MSDLSTIPFLDVDDDELSDEQILLKYPITYIGPTWERNPDGSFKTPKYTLGWGVAAWCAKYLKPLGEGQKVFTFTNEQFRFILWWYAVDENGDFLYQEAILQRIKGWGKDPLLAVLCLVEAFGPCRFDQFRNGIALGKRAEPEAWVQVYALSAEQTRNTSNMFPQLISPALRKHAQIKPGIEIIRGFEGTAQIELKTSSWRSSEGGRATFTMMNETQHWLSSNGGHQLAETIRNNAEKKGRVIAITNAPEPGEDSIAELDRKGYEGAVEGRLADREVLYDSVEAADHTPLVERVFKLVFEKVRGDAVWRNPHKAWLRVTDTAMKVTKARRMYLNQMWQPEGSLYTPDELARIKSEQTLQLGDRIVLGFDGGKTDDSTALVAIRVRDGLVVPLLLEEKPELVDQWVVNVATVEAGVHRAFRDYSVVAFFADVYGWETEIQTWGEDYGPVLEVLSSDKSPIGWDMRNWRRATRLHEQFMDAVLKGAVGYGPDPYGLNLDQAFHRHVMNAQRKDNTAGVSFMKRGGPESKRKVDMYAAAMLAYGAYLEVRMKDALKPEAQSTGWSINY